MVDTDKYRFGTQEYWEQYHLEVHEMCTSIQTEREQKDLEVQRRLENGYTSIPQLEPFEYLKGME
jgi:hypothetical protein